MEKLTKKERHEIYKKAYEKMKGTFMCGCEALFTSLFPKEKTVYQYYSAMELYFPEYYLFKRRDVKFNHRWFDDNNGLVEIAQRETAFELCIEMTR